MNITIESLLSDAKYLVTRLKDHDNAAESLAEQASTLQKEMEARNTYQENLIELNKVAGHRPKSTLVLGIQQENCAIRSLQQENDELRQSLVDHQNALELIMTKYRQQMIQFTKHETLEVPKENLQSEKQFKQQNIDLIEKICEMAAVMRRAADIDDKEFMKDYEEICRLEVENRSLRELLMISKGVQGAGILNGSYDKETEIPQINHGTIIRKVKKIDSDEDREPYINDNMSENSDDTLINGDESS